ncbi:MAG TPA: S1 RNA-binding domain-containing protein [Candidatus Faecivivens stercoripullorum]|uniref:S1 RNA-binding domain-containing protein n=1 Tax=Candidatus Faecivivens stercoripullorum TaxID=2840805 RepID=A0A9D1KSI1_9FIRM|nr:S1 RNA-binding domain-containing protein [Candidatus Faecivivens stercoripullorum]
MQLEIGKIVEGTVTGITKFGAFVDLGEGKTGMVHISEVAPTYVKEITDYLTQGQTVKVRILSIAPDGKIGLSVKQAMDNPPQDRPRRPRGEARDGQNQAQNQWHRDSRPAGRPAFKKADNFASAPRDWNSVPKNSGSKDFEDMLSKFMARSDEKISDLKRNTDGKRGSFGPRRGGKQQG